MTLFSVLSIIAIFAVAAIAKTEWERFVYDYNITQKQKREQAKNSVDPETFIRKYIEVGIRRGYWEYVQEDIDFLRDNHPKSKETEYLSVLMLHEKAQTPRDTMQAKEMMVRHILTYPTDTNALTLLNSDPSFYSNLNY